jgi:hypothetical protein
MFKMFREYMNAPKLNISVVLLLITVCQPLRAQVNTNDELQAVLRQDSSFWQHYNNCNTEAMRRFFTNDIEFYHDKGGVINGLENFLMVSKKNLCGNDNFRLKREAVPGTVKVFPMKDGDKLYGAILSGQHHFYIIENGKEPRLDGLARFTHLFLKTESGWKMSRVLSYDHGPAAYVSNRKEIKLSAKALSRHDGKYKAPQSGLCEIKHGEGLLILAIGDNLFKLYPESESIFFSKDRDLTFEFGNNKMVVRENGKIVEEAVRIK